MLCKICGNVEQNKLHVAREMMFGFKDEFNYVECVQCGCLQLAAIPKDMTKYYPATYYSYATPGNLGSILRRQRASYAQNRLNLLGGVVAYLFGADNALHSIARLKLSKNARILDVGCGSGGLLSNLRRMGYENLTGLDPFLPSDTEARGMRLLKKELIELEGEFDAIMLHHTFEHMEEPAQVLKQLNRLLSSGGTIILRIPLCDSYAWKHYGVNWYQLDAPRHFFLHTIASMAILAKEANLCIARTIYDSTLLQFIGSEQYMRGISQEDQRSYIKNPFRSIFTVNDIRSFHCRALQLNKDNKGDSACFYLRKIHNMEL